VFVRQRGFLKKFSALTANFYKLFCLIVIISIDYMIISLKFLLFSADKNFDIVWLYVYSLILSILVTR